MCPKIKLLRSFFYYNGIALLLMLLSAVCSAQKSDKIFQKADTLYSQQQYTKALKQYRKAYKTDAGNEKALWYMARCNSELGKYTEANKMYTQLVYVAKSVHPVVFLEYGNVLMKLGKTDKARTYFGSYNNLIEKNDLRALNYIKAIENYDKYFIDSSFVKIQKSTLSMQGQEACLSKYNDQVILASNSKYIKSNPLLYLLYSAKINESHPKPAKLGGITINKAPVNGIAIATTTDELFYTTAVGRQLSDLYRAFIQDDGTNVSKAEKILIENFEYNILSITTNETGNTLIFSSDAPTGKGGTDLYICTRDSYGYSEPGPVPGFINSMGNESNPYLVNDTLLFFTSDGHGGVGGTDIFFVNLNKPTSLPKNLGYPINSRFDEEGLVLFDKGKEGYLLSERGEEHTYTDVYKFELINQRAIGEVVDKESGENLKNVGIDVIKEGEDVSKYTLADNGKFTVTGEPGESFELSIWREGYEMEQFFVNTGNSSYSGLFEVGIGKFPIMKMEPETDTSFYIDDYFVPIEPIMEEPEEPVISDTVPERVIEDISEPLAEQADEPEVQANMKFRVQIAASRIPLSDQMLTRIYKGNRKIFMFNEEGWYKYAIAEFDSYFEANRVRKICGVQGAFVAAYRDDAKMVLRIAIEESVSNELKLTDKTTAYDDIQEIITKQEILFSYNEIEISESEINKLDIMVEQLVTDPETKVKIIGHTDMMGSKLYNYGLAKERAEYIESYLVKNGIHNNRITIVSLGELSLKEPCMGDDCAPSVHKHNRRAEVIIYKD